MASACLPVGDSPSRIFRKEAPFAVSVQVNLVSSFRSIVIRLQLVFGRVHFERVHAYKLDQAAAMLRSQPRNP